MTRLFKIAFIEASQFVIQHGNTKRQKGILRRHISLKSM